MAISELVIESIKESIGLSILFFVDNGFRYEGKVLACDGEYLKYFDIKKNSVRFIKLNQITEATLQ